MSLVILTLSIVSAGTFLFAANGCFQIATDTQEEADRYWNAIVGNGGQETKSTSPLSRRHDKADVTPTRYHLPRIASYSGGLQLRGHDRSSMWLDASATPACLAISVNTPVAVMRKRLLRPTHVRYREYLRPLLSL